MFPISNMWPTLYMRQTSRLTGGADMGWLGINGSRNCGARFDGVCDDAPRHQAVYENPLDVTLGLVEFGPCRLATDTPDKGAIFGRRDTS